MIAASEALVEVVANKQIAPEYFSMRLAGPARLTRFRPGQFLMLGWIDGQDPLLPRAMSIRRTKTLQLPFSKGGHGGIWRAQCEVEILYKVCGRGTTLLAGMRPGRSLRMLGPLGNGFEVPRRVTDVVLVAGGVGVPPIAALAETFAARRVSRRAKITAFLGGRSKVDLLCVPDLQRAGATVQVATEDGTAGRKGLVTELLEQYLNASHSKSPHPPFTKGGHGGIYACGPYPMLAALAPIAEKYNLPYQASLEANMACGFGACMGCVVPVKGDKRDPSACDAQAGRTYRLVCKEGPVFDGHDILWVNGTIPPIPSIRSIDQTDQI
ncbi:MAG: dihydroorotate dehydrogenase electron transfer subunit [candidate division NC10 bacterium]|nr:dihydroorotate dehydrogenase electron transfer subunit [candidate division NC10 bacterium]MDE2320688.1 dihydroorotate dehydrogenase electron transfer subunit [candidate division NC10 bacterium]